MKPICDLCKHQVSDNHGGVRCGAANYDYRGDYGPFKGGAVCVHDNDLTDRFEKRTGEEIEVRNLSGQIERLNRELSEKRDEIQILKTRLTKI